MKCRDRAMGSWLAQHSMLSVGSELVNTNLRTADFRRREQTRLTIIGTGTEWWLAISHGHGADLCHHVVPVPLVTVASKTLCCYFGHSAKLYQCHDSSRMKGITAHCLGRYGHRRTHCSTICLWTGIESTFIGVVCKVLMATSGTSRVPKDVICCRDPMRLCSREFLLFQTFIFSRFVANVLRCVLCLVWLPT